MGEANPGADTSALTQQLLYCSRWKATFTAVAFSAITLMLCFFVWELLDPDWTTNYYGYRSGLIKLLSYLPVWLRVLIVGPFALLTAWASFIYAASAYDRKPDFTIGPDGVGMWGFRRKLHFIRWIDLERVYVSNRNLNFESARSPQSRKPTRVIFSPSNFTETIADILTVVRHYRPDLKLPDA